jgi:hypothetical protein
MPALLYCVVFTSWKERFAAKGRKPACDKQVQQEIFTFRIENGKRLARLERLPLPCSLAGDWRRRIE